MDAGQSIRNTYSGFDEVINELMSILTMAPESNTAIWGVIKSIFNVMLPIGFSIATIFVIIGFIGKSMVFKVNSYEQVVKLFLVMAIGKAILENSFEILGWMYSIVADMIGAVGTSSASLEDLVDVEAMVAVAESMNGLERFFFNASQIPITLLTMIIKYAILVFAYGRMIEIYIYVAIAPIPLATAVSEDYNHIAKKFFQAYIGVCLQGLIMLLSCKIFTGLVVQFLNPATQHSSMGGGGGFLLASMVLLFVLAKSGTWGKQIVGLG